MKRPDDSSITYEQYKKVRAEAAHVLDVADAIGRFPTPVSDIMQAAHVEEVDEDVLTIGFVTSMRRKAGAALKTAFTKVLGLFDAKARLVFIDRSLLTVKQTFIRLHETAHGSLKWHRDLYAVVEDCQQTLAPETAELFDREANVFATEVLFQLDGFSNEAAQHQFGIAVPLKLSKKYGSSVYAAIRRYVAKSDRACTVLVLDPPQLSTGSGFSCNLRRIVISESFGACPSKPVMTGGAQPRAAGNSECLALPLDNRQSADLWRTLTR